MIFVAVIRPDAARAGEWKLPIEHFHAGVVGSDRLRLEQDLLGRCVQRVQQIRRLRHPAAHRFA
jgi:hypothetical protein